MDRQKHKFICVLLLILLILYEYKFATTREGGSVLMQGSIVLILLISAGYLVNFIFKDWKNNKFVRLWTLLLMVNVLGFVFTAEYNNKYHYGMFLAILVVFLVFYPFYFFSQNGILTRKHLIWFILILIPIAIYEFYSIQQAIIASRITYTNRFVSQSQDVVNNTAYFFVGLMPVVFLFKRFRILSIILMSIIMIFVIQGSKRGALISGAITVMFFIYYLIKTRGVEEKIRNYIFTFIGVLALSYFGLSTFMKNEYLVDRFDDISRTGGSGRDRIYATIFEQWFSNESFQHFLFGYGFAGSIKLTGGNYAHNDWLEITSNFGLFGFSIYLLLFISAIREIIRYQGEFNKRMILTILIITWFWASLVSMWYTDIHGYVTIIFLAYVLGQRFPTEETEVR